MSESSGDAFVPARFLHRRRDSAPWEPCEAAEAGGPQTEPGASGKIKSLLIYAWEQDSNQHLLLLVMGKCPYFDELRGHPGHLRLQSFVLLLKALQPLPAWSAGAFPPGLQLLLQSGVLRLQHLRRRGLTSLLQRQDGGVQLPHLRA